MTDVDAVARECAEKVIAAWDSTHPSWHDVSEPISSALRERDEEWQVKYDALLAEVERLKAERVAIRGIRCRDSD